jgi:hypothetical protein
MDRLTRLEQEIERKREEMYTVIERYGLSSQMALQKSQELDSLLNQYQNIILE